MLFGCFIRFSSHCNLFPVYLVNSAYTFYNQGTVFLFKHGQAKIRRFFKLMEFKTMKTERMPKVSCLPTLKDILAGKFVRIASRDELPQLWNVLKGDMSLFSPRPVLVQYLPLYIG